MNSKTLQETFSDFIFAVYGKRPNELPPQQARDLEFAFFAGAVACNESYLNATNPDDEQECVQKLDAIQNELNEFVSKSFPKSKQN